MPSDRRVIDGVAHVVLRDPGRPGSEVLVPVTPAATPESPGATDDAVPAEQV